MGMGYQRRLFRKSLVFLLFFAVLCSTDSSFAGTKSKRNKRARKQVVRVVKHRPAEQPVGFSKWKCGKMLAAGVMGIALVTYIAVPRVGDYQQQTQEQVQIELTEELLQTRLMDYPDQESMKGDFRLVATYLRTQVDWADLWYLLRLVDHADDRMSTLASSLGIPNGVLEDERTWGAYFRNHPDVDAIDELTSEALLEHWDVFREYVGPDLSQDATLEDFLHFVKEQLKSRDL